MKMKHILSLNDFLILESISQNFKKLIMLAYDYQTPIDADIINSKSKKGHTLDNLPKHIETISIDTDLFEQEQEIFGKVSDYKIAYHERPLNDKHWNNKIERGITPYILLEFDEDNNQLRVRDGNHRLNVMIHKGIKQIPVVLTINAKKYLTQML